MVFRRFFSKANTSDTQAPKFQEHMSSQLLKQATALKREQKIDDAIELIKQAHRVAITEPETLAASSYLKLPQYLLLANRNDEAWATLNEMLLNGISGQHPVKEMHWVECSQIYSQMAKQSKKEKCLKDAATYDVVSSVCWQKAMLIQDRPNDAMLDADKVIQSTRKALCDEPDDVVLRFVSVAKNALEQNGNISPSDVLRDLKLIVGS